MHLETAYQEPKPRRLHQDDTTMALGIHTCDEEGRFLSTSLRPFVTWMRLMGIDLLNRKSSYCNPWCFYGVFCFALNSVGQADVLYALAMFPYIYNWIVDGNTDSATTWNIGIDYINYAVRGVGSHLALLTALHSRWGRLLDALHRGESQLKPRFFTMLRRWSAVGVVSLILTFSGLIFMILSSFYRIEGFTQSLHKVIVNTFPTVSSMYSVSASILFGLVGYIAASLFQSLQEQIKHVAQHPHPAASLACIQRNHAEACEVVECINDCFGWNLLLSFTSLFVAAVNSAFYIFGDNEGFIPLHTSFAVADICQLMLLCMTAHSIKCQAKEFTRQVILLEIPDKKSLVRSLMTQLAHSNPQVTALGFFHVDRRIIPRAVATTLTYFFILLQFQSSE